MYKRLRAFGYAFSGLFKAVKSEAHLKVFITAALLVILAGFYFELTVTDWLILIAFISVAISLELINSALEMLCDFCKPEQHPKIKYIKDVAAASVLVTVIGAVVAAVLIFKPYFFK
jgi:undecaprenol kinase